MLASRGPHSHGFDGEHVDVVAGVVVRRGAKENKRTAARIVAWS
jgi:hypothetical protein